MADVSRLDLYALLEITDDASEKEIKTAYRKKALKCHPDKNPDNPAAIELFHQLSKALEVLTDVKARNAYDRILKARKAAEVRNRQLDSKRKKLKEDLESRERDAELEASLQKTERPEDAAKKLQAEIERLRREGSRQLNEEVELMRQQINEEMQRLRTGTVTSPGTTGGDAANCPRIKVQWKQPKGAAVPYDHDSLTSLFNKYGEVGCLVLSKKSRALIEFKSLFSDHVLNETGVDTCPLKVTWVTPPPAKATQESGPKPCASFVFHNVPAQNSPIANDYRDYESLVMMRLRQAEERKRLIEKLKREEVNGDGQG